MNEFTKKELQELLLGYEMHVHNNGRHFVSGDVVSKLRSLIDNYCEHESRGFWHQLADCSYRFKRCEKCRKEFDRHKWNNELQEWENEKSSI